MLDDIATWLTETWSGFVRFVEFNPGPLYATLLVVSALLFSITIGVFAARLRGLRVRTRQLSDRLDTLSSLVDQTIAVLAKKDEQISQPQAQPVPEPIKRDEPLPSASIREELESLRLALQAPGETTPAVPTSEEAP